LARGLHGRLPVVYSGPGAPEAALLRWRTQLNENAKVLCHTAVVPEMNHNEVVGWSGTDPWVGQAVVLLLREGSEDRRTARRLAVTRDWLGRRGVPILEAEGEGATGGERLWWLCHLADYASVYLALLRGVDPTPVAAIAELKKRLAEDDS
jgi:glucose/mannose-6-phosphate isomerase